MIADQEEARMELKLVLIMYLEEDEGCVNGLLSEQDVGIFSRLSMEGLARGAGSGWYGVGLPYQSRLIMSLLPIEQADALMAAVARCRGVQDPRHPIRAVQLAVERSAACECSTEAVDRTEEGQIQPSSGPSEESRSEGAEE